MCTNQSDEEGGLPAEFSAYRPVALVNKPKFAMEINRLHYCGSDSGNITLSIKLKQSWAVCWFSLL